MPIDFDFPSVYQAMAGGGQAPQQAQLRQAQIDEYQQLAKSHAIETQQKMLAMQQEQQWAEAMRQRMASQGRTPGQGGQPPQPGQPAQPGQPGQGGPAQPPDPYQQLITALQSQIDEQQGYADMARDMGQTTHRDKYQTAANAIREKQIQLFNGHAKAQHEQALDVQMQANRLEGALLPIKDDATFRNFQAQLLSSDPRTIPPQFRPLLQVSDYKSAKGYIDSLVGGSKEVAEITQKRALAAAEQARANQERISAQKQADEDKALRADMVQYDDYKTHAKNVGKEPLSFQAWRTGKGNTEAGGGRGAAAIEMQRGRIVNAAEELSLSMNSVSKLPMDTVGTFGSIKGGDTILNSVTSTLGRKVTPSSQQEYKVMMSGVPRFLATLETYGVASGVVGVQKQMEAIINQPGDTVKAQLRKSAEIRQLFDGALKQVIKNPKTPDDVRQILMDAQGRMHDAVPFTHDDLTEWTKSGKGSIKDFIASKHSGASSTPAADDIGAKVKAAGVDYEPDKYDYRVGPNGEVQRKAK